MKAPINKLKLQSYIGKRIKEIREKKGIPQQVLAAQCNMEKSNLSRLESGGSNPTYYTLYKIAFYLKIPLSELTDLKEKN